MPRKRCKVDDHHTRIRCKIIYIISRKYDAVLCARKIDVKKFGKQIKLYENSENTHTRQWGPDPWVSSDRITRPGAALRADVSSYPLSRRLLTLMYIKSVLRVDYSYKSVNEHITLMRVFYKLHPTPYHRYHHSETTSPVLAFLTISA